jgi:hypothetical protein
MRVEAAIEFPLHVVSRDAREGFLLARTWGLPLVFKLPVVMKPLLVATLFSLCQQGMQT